MISTHIFFFKNTQNKSIIHYNSFYHWLKNPKMNQFYINLALEFNQAIYPSSI